MNSALQRMSVGDHKFVKMKEQDTVVLSSTPIPETGNDAAVGNMVDDLLRRSVHVFRHETRELDGTGPLHVSGHASIEEYGDLIDMLKPKFFVPIYGSFRSKQRHIDIAIDHGIPRANTINAENGDVIEVAKQKMYLNGHVENGSVLVDNTGAVVPNVVVKDRIVMAADGVVTVILTVDRVSGRLLTSPDIITRGFIYMRENEDLMNGTRAELKRAVAQRYKRVELDRFKTELKDHITHYLYEHTQRSPMVLPVVNVVGPGEKPKRVDKPQPDSAHD
jgi:ribonuclease J